MSQIGQEAKQSACITQAAMCCLFILPCLGASLLARKHERPYWQDEGCKEGQQGAAHANQGRSRINSRAQAETDAHEIQRPGIHIAAHSGSHTSQQLDEHECSHLQKHWLSAAAVMTSGCHGHLYQAADAEGGHHICRRQCSMAVVKDLICVGAFVTHE